MKGDTDISIINVGSIETIGIRADGSVVGVCYEDIPELIEILKTIIEGK